MSPTKTYTIAGERYELTPSQMIAYRQATMPGDVAGQAAYAHGHFSACRVASRALVAPVRSKPAAAKKPTSSAIDADLKCRSDCVRRRGRLFESTRSSRTGPQQAAHVKVH